MKKLFTALLSVMLICCAVFTVSSAEKSGVYEYRILLDGTAEITDVDYSCSDNVIPGELDGHTVTSIGPSAFFYCSKLTDVTLPETLTSIGRYAFANCTKMKSINIPDSVQFIDEGAFADCAKLTSFRISPDHPVYIFNNDMLLNKQNMTLLQYTGKGGDYEVFWGIKAIGAGAFEGKNLKSVVIPNSVTSIGDFAFRSIRGLKSISIPDTVTFIGFQNFYGDSQLQSVTLPAGLKELGYGSFGWCTALKSIEVSPDNPYFEMKDNMLIEKGTHKLVYFLDAVKGTLEIPEEIQEIESNAFENNKGLKEIIIPNSVKAIRNAAFNGCQNVTAITLPEGLKEIEFYTFERCSKLESLVIPDGVTYIGGYAFEDCKSLKELIIPASVTEINQNAFYGCKKLVCMVAEGSYAQKFCAENNINYIVK
ncbi:MAG: leucine-rich repeat domain-containing protein [Clostridia bacterium]|nr:leucine-rich repeat domain-containing protein [Clostridia bacterium]